MNLREDFKLLRPALLLATALLLAGLFAAGLAHLWRAEREVDHRQALDSLRNFQTRLARIEDEAGEIRAGGQLFDRLVARGIVGKEPRAEWIEQIRHIRTERRLFDIRWELQASQPLEADIAPGDGGGYDMLASRLQVHLPLLHEEDLLRFLGDMRDTLQAFVRPRQCTLEPASPEAGQETAIIQPRLQADCELDLITLSPPPAAQPAANPKP